jgi:P pilus assembly chaperone PapD
MDDKLVSLAGLFLASVIISHAFASLNYIQIRPIVLEQKEPTVVAINNLNKKYMEDYEKDLNKLKNDEKPRVFQVNYD